MNLQEYRKLKHISVKQASEELEITGQHIYDIEKRKAFPSRKLSQKINKWSNGLVTQMELLFPEFTVSVNDCRIRLEKKEGNENRGEKPKFQRYANA